MPQNKQDKRKTARLAALEDLAEASGSLNKTIVEVLSLDEATLDIEDELEIDRCMRRINKALIRYKEAAK